MNDNGAFWWWVIASAVWFIVAALGDAHADDCAPRDGIIAKLDADWGETLRAAGETDGGLLEIYANSKTRTWTIILTRPDMSACLLATGDDWLAPEHPMPRPKGEPT